MSQTRRSFLASTLAAGTAAGLFTIAGTKASGKVLGANDTIRIAVCGVNGRGGAHIDAWTKIPNVQVSYLVDPDTRLHSKVSASVQAKGSNTPQTVVDLRKALEDKNLDAISVATPNHWHTLCSIWACQAEKDVYVEKPLSHNVHEGRVLVETAKKYNRIVQHGTQSRGSNQYSNLAADIAAGKKGKLLVSRGTCYKRRTSIGMKDLGDAPTGVDFNVWLGPAKQQPFHANLVHYNWHWFWDFGNGDIGNQGVHEMDKARWIIPNATLPKSVISVGGRFGYKDQGQTPNTQITIMDFGDTQLIFEVRGLDVKNDKDGAIGVGNDQVFDKDAKVQPVKVASQAGVKNPTDSGRGDVFKNFIDCMRSRNTADQVAHVLEGHYSAALCHLANLSIRLGQPVGFDASKKAFATDDKFANEAFARMEDHLKTNEVSLTDTKYILGKKLEIDAAAEKITNDPAANELLTREYRAPFVVPEKA